MILPVSQIQNVLRTYGKQLNVARLNSENKLKITQGQVDRVEISDAARQMLSEKTGTNNSNEPAGKKV